jgi:uncharacterized protein YbjT (DUF2867 family)
MGAVQWAMANVLVTGGSGTLGRHVVTRLRALGHDVRVLSRSPHRGTHRGDLSTGIGVAAALRGVDSVIHAASDSRRFGRRDVVHTRTLLDMMPPETRHLLYISIVGIDSIPFGYYRQKLRCEGLITDSDVPSTILRATQFHELAASVLRVVQRMPLAPIPSGFLLQPVAAREVADRLVDLLDGSPTGRADDFGGPEVLPLSHMAEAWRIRWGRPRRFVSVPLPGRAASAFREGLNTSPLHSEGHQTWHDYLNETGPV